MLPQYLEVLAASYGLPQTNEFPQSVAVGNLGWKYDCANGAVAVNNDFMSLVASNAAVPRLGGIINTFDENATPKVFFRAEYARVELLCEAADAITPAIIESLAGVTLRHRPSGGRDIFYPLWDSLTTFTEEEGGAVASFSRVGTHWVSLGTTIDIDMETDQLALSNKGAVQATLPPAGSLNIWFKGAFVASKSLTGEVDRASCGTSTAAVRNNLFIRQSLPNPNSK